MICFVLKIELTHKPETFFFNGEFVPQTFQQIEFLLFIWNLDMFYVRLKLQNKIRTNKILVRNHRFFRHSSCPSARANGHFTIDIKKANLTLSGQFQFHVLELLYRLR